MENHEVTWTMTLEEVRAMKAKYELLDGDNEEKNGFSTSKERESFLIFANENILNWLKLVQADEVLEEKTWERVRRQKALYECGKDKELWKDLMQLSQE
ncbi:MAG: hypothetical protein SFU91_13920 [Chloroherpetonaceae bacterium]|nr:hypothetical protein [Chloroherpetonaceae bacterium]